MKIRIQCLGSPEDGIVPDLLFLKVPEGKVVKNRLHLDLRPGDQGAEVARLEALGARRVSVGQGEVSWVVMATRMVTSLTCCDRLPLMSWPRADESVSAPGTIAWDVARKRPEAWSYRGGDDPACTRYAAEECGSGSVLSTLRHGNTRLY